MKVQNDIRVTVRVDKDLKRNADILFERLGMNMSTAFNVFLRKAVDESAIPFPISIRCNSFRQGYTEEEITEAFMNSVQNEVDENKKKGAPIARYDTDKRKAYLEFPDGTREYVND